VPEHEPGQAGGRVLGAGLAPVDAHPELRRHRCSPTASGRPRLHQPRDR
jgi:hypothetical protein